MSTRSEVPKQQAQAFHPLPTITRRRNLRVLVMEPPNQQLPHDRVAPNGSLGPACLVGALREQGIEADYLDGTVGTDINALDKTFYNRVTNENGTTRYGMTREMLAEVISGYDVVATSSIFTAQTRMHFEIAEIAKQVAREGDREILVVSGGVNARALHPHFLKNNFDIIGFGDGERTIVHIIDQYSRPNPDFHQLSGVAFMDGDHVVLKSVDERTNVKFLDSLPFPALDALPLEIYKHLRVSHAGMLEEEVMFSGIQTSRGCQDSCTFCHISFEKANPQLVGNVGFLRLFAKERLREEVTRAMNLGVRLLYFEDDNLFFNKKRLIDLASVLKRDGLSFSNFNGANVRFLFKKDPITGGFIVDEEFIEVLADFGLKQLVLPFESRSQEMLDEHASGKYKPDVMDSFAVVRALNKVGIRTHGNFMIGFRDEPWESVVATKDYAKALRQDGLGGAGFMIPVPYPGSVDFEIVMQDKVIREDFDRDPLKYTDRMYFRGKPLFHTLVPGEKLAAAVREFWEEIHDDAYKTRKNRENVGSGELSAAQDAD